MDAQSEKDNVQNETEVATSSAKAHRRRNLVIVTLLFLITVAVVALTHFLSWQHEEETKDAYVAGCLAMITLQANSMVRKVIYDDTDVMGKGDVLAALDDSDLQLIYGRTRDELTQAIRQNKQ